LEQKVGIENQPKRAKPEHIRAKKVLWMKGASEEEGEGKMPLPFVLPSTRDVSL
jgi:hypothetical protein